MIYEYYIKKNIDNIETISDYNQIIPYSLLYPQYTDNRFNDKTGWKFKTIFLKNGWEISSRGYCKGLFYVYDDKLDCFFSLEEKRIAEKEASVFNKNSANYFQEYLRSLKKSKKLKLIHILSGVNCSTCYSYRIFGYKN